MSHHLQGIRLDCTTKYSVRTSISCQTGHWPSIHLITRSHIDALEAFQYDCNHVRQCCRRVENSVFPCVLATGITWNELHWLTCLEDMFVSLWHCDVSKDAMRRNVVPRTYYNLQVQLITVFESWGHPLMMRRKVKGLKDIWRGTPLPRSSMNQNDVNQIQVTKLSIQCNNDRPNCWYS